jgi:hypothetical protein
VGFATPSDIGLGTGNRDLPRDFDHFCCCGRVDVLLGLDLDRAFLCPRLVVLCGCHRLSDVSPELGYGPSSSGMSFFLESSVFCWRVLTSADGRSTVNAELMAELNRLRQAVEEIASPGVRQRARDASTQSLPPKRD